MHTIYVNVFVWELFKNVALQSVNMWRQKLWTAHSAALKTASVSLSECGCTHREHFYWNYLWSNGQL